MSKRNENRRENLRRLQKEYGGPKEFAEKLGYANASFLVQMTGPNPTREVTEKTARRFEQQLKLEDGSLDWPVPHQPATRRHAPTHEAAQNTQFATRPHVSGDTAASIELIRVLATVMEQERVTLPPTKMGDIVSFALQSGMARDEETMRNLLHLMT